MAWLESVLVFGLKGTKPVPVSSSDFINFAKDCFARDDEIGYRNAIARAYYGAYHNVIPYLANGPTDSHQGLIDYLMTMAWKGNESFQKADLIALGYALQALKDQRVVCDYRLAETITRVQSSTAIKTAEKIISRCLEMQKNKAS